MKKIFILLAIAASTFSCQYDDSGIWGAIDDLSERVETLEKTATQTNTNIAALQKLVESLEGNLSIVSVVPTDKGYTINFSDGTTAEIKNGESAPVVSIKKDTDGIYYWTMNGEWLLNEEGEKMAVEGEAAIAPQVQINETSLEWEISVDGGETWTSTGIVAVGDSFFKSVDSETSAEYVIFTLADGTQFNLPKYSELNFEIEDYTFGTVKCIKPSTTTKFAVTMVGVAEYIMDYSEGWDVAFDGETLSITAPATDATSCEVSFILNSTTGSVKIVKIKLLTAEFNLLTFEDTPTGNYWSSLIDTEEYGGSLLYGNEDGYSWIDENTQLTGGMVDMDFWSGGNVISNYVLPSYDGANYTKQLSVTPAAGQTNGGYNNSKNFAIFNIMAASEYSMDNLTELNEYIPALKLTDGSEQVFDHMYITNTSLMLNSLFYGDGYTEAYKSDDLENEYIKLCAYGFDKDGQKVSKVDIYLLDEKNDSVITDWTKFDLSGLGAVNSIVFLVDGNNAGDWGFNRPSYVAYDNIAVQW